MPNFYRQRGPACRQAGQIELLVLLGVVLLFSYFVAGGLFPSKSNQTTTTEPTTVNGRCCDLDDDADCKAYTDDNHTFTLDKNHEKYGLLKSGVTFTESVYHLKGSGQKLKDSRSPDGAPIVLNVSSEFIRLDGGQSWECGQGQNDQVYGDGPGGCVAIPNDALVYVCRDHCDEHEDQYNLCDGKSALFPNLSCFGGSNSVYDVYFKLSEPKVPDVIANCPKTSPQSGAVVGKVIVPPPTGVNNSLQLKSFSLIQAVAGSTPWISPWCKPAIYLYPTEKTDVHVQVAPQGKLNLTIPLYPQEGWNVIAEPNGTIISNGITYDYLYYEAQIPDTLIAEPNEGFVTSYFTLATFFSDLLPKLGLNNNESSQFSQYWLKALPYSPYYFIGVVSLQNLDTIAPLTIHPTPDTTLRVTLYFKALDEPVTVTQPTISPIKRNGFTVVEWGGIVKTDLTHPFSCFM